MISIVDYGMGNLGSMHNMFRRLGVQVRIESSPEAIVRAHKIVLPGVGAFDAAMQRINEVPGLRQALDIKALVDRIPVLGVCLGMQLLTNASEEGVLPGLGWISGSARRFPKRAGLKVPHMGWNVARPTSAGPLLAGIEAEPRYYFVHSYYVTVDRPEHSMMRTCYGLEFDSAIASGNVFGVQFHPEKSHKFGMRILKNFADL